MQNFAINECQNIVIYYYENLHKVVKKFAQVGIFFCINTKLRPNFAKSGYIVVSGRNLEVKEGTFNLISNLPFPKAGGAMDIDLE